MAPLHPEPSALSSEYVSSWTFVGFISAARKLVGSTGEDNLSDERVGSLPTRRVQALTDRAFKTLDSPHPGCGARSRYDMLVEVLEERARAVTREGMNSSTVDR